MIVRITTPELKKFRMDSKKVDVDIVDEGYRIIVSPTESQHILNHNRNLYPGVGTIITIDAFNHFYCMEALVVGARKSLLQLLTA